MVRFPAFVSDLSRRARALSFNLAALLVSRLRCAALSAALADLLGDLHLLPRLFHRDGPHSRGGHLPALLRAQEERLQQPDRCPEASEEHPSEETGNRSRCGCWKRAAR